MCQKKKVCSICASQASGYEHPLPVPAGRTQAFLSHKPLFSFNGTYRLFSTCPTPPSPQPGLACAPWAGSGVSHPYKNTGGEQGLTHCGSRGQLPAAGCQLGGEPFLLSQPDMQSKERKTGRKRKTERGDLKQACLSRKGT